MRKERPDLGPQAWSGKNPYRMALRRLRFTFVGVALFSALINILMLTGPLYMLQVYDRVLSSGSIATLKGLFLIVVVLYAFMGFYEFLRSRLLARAAVRLDLAVGPQAFRAWLRGTGRNQGDDEAARPLTDLEVVRGFLSGPAMGGIFDLPWIPLYLGVLFLIHPLLGWLTLAGAMVVALAAWMNRVLTRGSQETSGRIEAEARSFAEHGQRNGEIISAMGMEGRITSRWWHLRASGLAAGQGASNVSEVTGAFSKSFRMLLQSAMLTLGAWLVLRDEMSAGMIIASSILSGRALAPVDMIIAQWRVIGRASLSHRRLKTFFDKSARQQERVDLPVPTGQISVTRLTRLAPGAPGTERSRALNQISFELQPGEGLGVIGNSAAGKSTLARLLVGAWTPDMGEIRLDGATRDQWDPEILGRSIGYLPQVVELLPGTIRDNIARFDDEARDEDVFAAARLAGVHEMILGLPEGYATRVGMPGQPLSGGQVQRLGLVRAVFGNPRILVLDEPNSNLDASGEAALTAAIRTLREGGTTVVLMTHRTSALAEMNRIMLLNAGSIVRLGERDEVLRGAMLRPVASGEGSGAASAGPARPLSPGMKPAALQAARIAGGMPQVANLPDPTREREQE